MGNKLTRTSAGVLKEWCPRPLKNPRKKIASNDKENGKLSAGDKKTTPYA
nr:hypothetical protein [Methanobacterium formicicum]